MTLKEFLKNAKILNELGWATVGQIEDVVRKGESIDDQSEGAMDGFKEFLERSEGFDQDELEKYHTELI